MIGRLTRRELLVSFASVFVVGFTSGFLANFAFEETKRYFLKYASLEVLNLERQYYAYAGQPEDIMFYLYNSGNIPADIKYIFLYCVVENNTEIALPEKYYKIDYKKIVDPKSKIEIKLRIYPIGNEPQIRKYTIVIFYEPGDSLITGEFTIFWR